MADTIALMKQRVLDMAIRGELVDQRPEDGTAEELFHEIQLIKKQKIKNGEIKKNQKFSEIGEKKKTHAVPQVWKWVRLGEIGTIVNGNSINAKIKEEKYSTVEEGYSYISTKDINLETNEIDYDNGVRIPFDEKLKFKIAPNNSILICAEGGSAGKKIAFTENEVAFVNKLFNFNGFNNQMNRYIYYIFMSEFFNTKFEDLKTGIIGGVSMSNFNKIAVPLPPLQEQKRIVAKIEEIFAVIDQIGTKKEEALSIIRNMRQTALQDAIMGVLVEQDENDEPASVLYEKIQAEKEQMVKEKKIKKEKPLPEIEVDEIPFDIPESWKWARMGEVGQTSIGLTYKPTDKSENGTIVLRSSNIQNGKMDYSDIVRVDLNIPETKKCEIGDLLICARNGSKRLVGKAALVDEEGHSFGAFMANYRSRFNQYIYYYMRSNFFRSLLGESGTTTINQITQRMLKEFPLPLPPLGEQERIVDKLDEIMAICDQMESILDGSSEMVLERIN